MITTFQTDRFGKTVQTQIKEQSDQGQRSSFFFLCHLHHLDTYHTMVEPLSLNFRVVTVKLMGVQKIMNFRVIIPFVPLSTDSPKHQMK